jgi:hypothetical protein
MKKLYSDEVLLDDLRRVASLNGKRTLSQREYEPHGIVYGSTFITRFGSWNRAVTLAGLECNLCNWYKLCSYFKREPVPAALRLQIFTRDDFTCQICSNSPAFEHGLKLHVDHIVPVSLGGGREPSNLRTLCARCNLQRGAGPDPKKGCRRGV